MGIRHYLLLILTSCLLYGCVLARVTEARLYDFNSGMLSNARFYDIDEQHGRVTAKLYNGEELRGEFTLTNEHPSALPRVAQIEFDQAPTAPKQGDTDEAPPPRAGKTLAGVFGFAPDGDAKPVGVATLVGDKGTVLQVVIYELNIEQGTGSGVGLDNKGNWYLVRIGS